MPQRPPPLVLPFIAAIFLVTLVELGVLSVAFEKLGLSTHSAYLLFLVTLAGSPINLPLFSLKAGEPPPPESLPAPLRDLLASRPLPYTGRTIIAVNAGGCVTPVAFSLYLLTHNPVSLPHAALAVAAVAAASYFTSFAVPGIGIVIPALVAPLVSAFMAVLLDPAQRAVLAYVGGTLGVVIGADLLRLKDLRNTGAPVASIGGAGTFDGIFLAGILAVLLT
jgi:uncharacterized membrane protein